jgi:threonyl-tRNA synthetase
VQVALLPISEKHARAVQQLSTSWWPRVRARLIAMKINLKIRRAQLEKVPFMVVIGDREVENGTLSVRNRFDGDMGTFSFEKFLELIQHLKSTRAVRP